MIVKNYPPIDREAFAVFVVYDYDIPMIILSIESSCDETAAAVLKIEDGNFSVLANEVSSQIDIHKKYGGVVPEVAARQHVVNIVPVIDHALEYAHTTPEDIDIISVVNGPGLNMSLLVGIEAAKTLAYVWEKPLVPVDHIRSHILANYISGTSGTLADIRFPALCLVVSGGHTELVLLDSPHAMRIIGSTRDDAVGEAFDKVAAIIGLGYPGGPAISKEAESGDSTTYDLPRPMMHSRDFDFSFSGLKTAVRLAWGKKQDVAGMSASFQQAVIDVLVSKTEAAAKEFEAKSVLLGGGVSANKELRRQLGERFTDSGIQFYEPDLTMTTDNALMAAVTAYFQYTREPALYKNNWDRVTSEPNLSIMA